MSKRGFFVAGNWRMNGDKSTIDEITSRLNRAPLDPETEAVIAPPTIYLDYTRAKLTKKVAVAAQNCYKEEKGAFTGDISPAMIKDCGADWVILGHSERRRIFGESDELIVQKIERCEQDGLKLILCVGETLSETAAGNSYQVLFRQMSYIADAVQDWSKVVLVYEPVWAIATGKVITPPEVQLVLKNLRMWLHNHVSDCVAERIRILFGGQVNANNCKIFATKPDLDGFLVSDASLDPGQFMHIINCKKPL